MNDYLREAEHEAWRAEELAKGVCPDSGERLRPAEIDAWNQLSRACAVCDCFGYDPNDERLKDRCRPDGSFHSTPHKGCFLR